MMSQDWKLVAATRRYYRAGPDQRFLIVGDDGQEPPLYWFSVWRRGREIAHDEGFETVEAAQEAAVEAV